LTEQQKLQVTNSNKLFDGIEDLNQKLAPHLVLDFIDSLVLENITKENGYQIPSFYNQYIDFTQEQLSILTIEKRSILEEAYDIYSSLIGDVYKWIPETSENTDNFFNYQGDSFVNNAGTFTVFGESLTLAGKLNSSATITFTTTVANAKLIIVVKTRSTQTQGRLDINGIIYDLDTYYNEEGIAYIEVTLEEAGTYTIKRNNRELAVFYIEVEQ